MNKKISAKKSLGQNFLHSTDVRDGILAAAGELAGKNVLEIGPGKGFLTEKLLEAGAHVTAVELDDRLIPFLEERFGDHPNFNLIHGSILIQDLDEIFEQKKYSVIANIPYNITNPIIKKLLAETKNSADFCILMVQKEVAEKICPVEKKGQIKRSILSISVEVFAEAQILFGVPRQYFSPAPKVDSAIIRFDVRPQALVSKANERDFFTVVNAGFQEKRKKIGNSLRRFFGIDSKLLLGEIDENLRPENLSVTDWQKIAENFQQTFKR